MGTDDSPMEIVNIAAKENADDDDVSILFSSPPITSRRRNGGGTNIANAISVENYCDSIEDRDLRSALIASVSTTPSSSTNRRNFIDLSHDHDVVNNNGPFRRGNGILIYERGESSHSANPNPNIVVEIEDDKKDSAPQVFLCEICYDQKELSESFCIRGCSHSYCSDCIQKYVASKIQENISQINCPVSGCAGILEPEYCRSILPPEVFDRWGEVLCEAVILASQKFYCPFKDCSAMLIQDDEGNNGILESECPVCWRLFCAQCKVPWHSGIVCGEFQKLHKDEREREDILLMDLAKKNKWIRCPKCKIYVEKSVGCVYMRCRCGHTFCYNCGAHMKTHTAFCSQCQNGLVVNRLAQRGIPANLARI